MRVSFVSLLLALFAAVPAGQAPTYEVILSGGRLVDGTGAPWVRADLAITGDRIAAIGDLSRATATTRIDVTGLVVAPGFIDMLGQSEDFVLVDGRAASKITQGITTEITGEGKSIAPVNARMIAAAKPSWDHYGIVQDFSTLAGYFERLERRSKPAINVGSFVGAGGVRDYVMGRENRPATSDDLAAMEKLVEQAMQEGALGLSTSLQYVPDRFASTEEIIALAKVARRHGGIYITHQRSESGQIFESLDEVFRIAKEADIPAEVWHLKTAYKANWGKMPEVLKRFEAARAAGLDVTANQYPYTRASNGLDACLPLWVREGGTDAMLKRLADPALRERIKREMDDPNTTGWENQWYGSGGSDGVMLASVLNKDLKKYEGMTFTAIGAVMGKDPRDAVMDLVVADRADSSVIIAIMEESDVRTALAHPLVSIDTDSGARAEDGPLSGSRSHPRGMGHLPAHPGQVRAPGEAADARGGHPQDDLARRRAGRPEGPRHPARGALRRHHGLRPRHDPRRRDLRGSEPLLGRRSVRIRERTGGHQGRGNHRLLDRADHCVARDTRSVIVNRSIADCRSAIAD